MIPARRLNTLKPALVWREELRDALAVPNGKSSQVKKSLLFTGKKTPGGAGNA